MPAIAPLISVILSTFFVYITRADKQGVQIVRVSLVTLSNEKILIVLMLFANDEKF